MSEKQKNLRKTQTSGEKSHSHRERSYSQFAKGENDQSQGHCEIAFKQESFENSSQKY